MTRTIFEIIGDNADKIELRDACKKETGGICYKGETLDNFMAECELDLKSPFDCLIEAMEECDVTFGYFYISRHGLGPGTVPPKLELYDTYPKGWKIVFRAGRALTQEELDFYDLQTYEM